MSHFIVKCSCGAIIAQCRCPSEHKNVRYEKCALCKSLEAPVHTAPPTGYLTLPPSGSDS